MIRENGVYTSSSKLNQEEYETREKEFLKTLSGNRKRPYSKNAEKTYIRSPIVLKTKIKELEEEMRTDNPNLSVIENYKRKNLIEHYLNEAKNELHFYETQYKKFQNSKV